LDRHFAQPIRMLLKVREYVIGFGTVKIQAKWDSEMHVDERSAWCHRRD